MKKRKKIHICITYAAKGFYLFIYFSFNTIGLSYLMLKKTNPEYAVSVNTPSGDKRKHPPF